MYKVKMIIIAMVLIFQYQDTYMKVFSENIFNAIVNKDLKTIKQYSYKDEDFDQVEFYDVISDEKKYEFRRGILESSYISNKKAENSLNEFSDKMVKAKIKPSEIKFINATEEMRDLDLMNLSMGQIYITYSFNGKEEIMSVQVVKIKK